MNRSDLTDDVLAARIAAACRAQHERVAVADRPFEPGAAAPVGLPLAPAGRRRHRIVLAAAAIAVVGALAAALVVLGGDDPHDQVRTASTTTPTTPSGDWLAPSSAPLGLELQSVTWSAKPPLDGFELRAQLFETADGDGAVYVAIQPGTGNLLGEPGPAVQGHETSTMRSKYGDGATMTWHDRDHTIDAQWHGIDQAAAAALFDQLRWRTDDPMDGFEVAPGGTASLVDEAAPTQVSHQAELVYAPEAGTGTAGVEELRIATAAGDGSSWDAVESEFFARFPDGRDSVDYGGDPGLRQFEAASPGRLVRIDAGVSDVTDGQLQTIADSIVPIDEAGLRALQRQTPGAELASDPAVTATTGGSATSVPDAGTSGLPIDAPVQALDGGATTLREVADGRPMVVLLWAPSCVPCIQSLEEFDQIATAHPGSVVAAVAVGGTAEDVQRVVDGLGVGLPVLLDPDGTATAGFERSVLPFAVLVEADGGSTGSGPAGGVEGPAIAAAFLDEAG